MTFEEALRLCESINRRNGWTAEIEAGSEGETAYIQVSARYERRGLAYTAEIESLEQWRIHLERIEEWEKWQ